MNETLNLGITEQQRELLLAGLRYIRSSVMLELRDPEPDFRKERDQKLHEIAHLVEQLGGPRPATASTSA